MPRKDPTFTDSDLLRLYCNNLDPAEKYRVFEAFRNHVMNGQKICADDPDEKTDLCGWIANAQSVLEAAKEAASLLKYALSALVALEAVLIGLSWVGPLARVLVALRAFVAYLISIVIFATTILIMVGDLMPLILFLNKHLCKGEKPSPLPPPPGLDLPEPPQRLMDTIVAEIESAFQAIKDFFTGIYDWF